MPSASHSSQFYHPHNIAHSLWDTGEICVADLHTMWFNICTVSGRTVTPYAYLKTVNAVVSFASQATDPALFYVFAT